MTSFFPCILVLITFLVPNEFSFLSISAYGHLNEGAD